MSWLSASVSQSVGYIASISVLPMNIQGSFSSGLTGLISLSKGLSGIFSSTTVPRPQFFGRASESASGGADAAGPGTTLGEPLLFSAKTLPCLPGSLQSKGERAERRCSQGAYVCVVGRSSTLATQEASSSCLEGAAASTVFGECSFVLDVLSQSCAIQV